MILRREGGILKISSPKRYVNENIYFACFLQGSLE
jgi:hypothetical protein